MTTAHSRQALASLREHKSAINAVLRKYGASNPRLFGSVARGTAGPDSDIDLLLDLAVAGEGSRLARLSSIQMELQELLKLRIDVAYDEILKEGVSEAAHRQAIAL